MSVVFVHTFFPYLFIHQDPPTGSFLNFKRCFLEIFCHPKQPAGRCWYTVVNDITLMVVLLLLSSSSFFLPTPPKMGDRQHKLDKCLY